MGMAPPAAPSQRLSQAIQGKLQNCFPARRSGWYVTWYDADAISTRRLPGVPEPAPHLVVQGVRVDGGQGIWSG
jgi:hypothetical protein